MDFEGARETTRNFVQECPGVSQMTSVVQLSTGDVDGALETQKKCLGTVNNVANGIPGIGHAKGIVHHIVGDHEGGNQALNAATRSTVVVASGAAAAVATGGIGAVPAGIAAGLAYDASASAITGEEQGYLAALKNVAENPSAGAFIDAIAIPVGDGLAGYSGGRMANEIQLNHLENVRATKLDQMDGAATSAEALKYAREANDLTAKINTIKHGTPKYWNDPKAGTTASETSSSNVTIPVAGHIDKNDQKQEKIITGISRDTDVHQEDALYYDSYVKTITATNGNRKDAQKKLQNSDEQPPKGDVHKNYNGVKFTTFDILTGLLKNFGDDPQPNGKLRDCVKELFKWYWLLLTMPKEFSYTLAAQVNSPYGGLYHSFIRHIHEWAEVIPSDFSRVTDRLSPLSIKLSRLASANNNVDANEAREEFLEARKGLTREEYNDFQAAMIEIQMAMYRFIQQNLTFDNYQGRSLNTNNQVRLYFKVQTESGTKAMVLCLSNELYEPVRGDARPIRLLMTVFFESWEKFTSHGLLETKKEMQAKRKK